MRDLLNEAERYVDSFASDNSPNNRKYALYQANKTHKTMGYQYTLHSTIDLEHDGVEYTFEYSASLNEPNTDEQNIDDIQVMDVIRKSDNESIPLKELPYTLSRFVDGKVREDCANREIQDNEMIRL